MLLFPLYQLRTNNPVTPPIVIVKKDDGGGGNRRKHEMSVEQWHLRNRQFREDDVTLEKTIMMFLKGIQ